jgi:hypothetical protein
MEDNDPLKGYKIRWVQAYNLSGKLTAKDLEMIARKMLAEIEEEQMLKDSGYAEANEVINHIKSL